jgi:hypothetical protein
VVFVKYDSTQLIYDDRRAKAFLSYRPISDLTLTLTGDVYRTDYTLPVRQSRGYNARFEVNWYAPGGALLTGYANHHLYEDTQLPTDEVSEGGVRLRWNWRLMELNAVAALGERNYGTTHLTDRRFLFNIVRRF